MSWWTTDVTDETEERQRAYVEVFLSGRAGKNVLKDLYGDHWLYIACLGMPTKDKALVKMGVDMIRGRIRECCFGDDPEAFVEAMAIASRKYKPPVKEEVEDDLLGE